MQWNFVNVLTLVFAVLAVISALTMITRRNPISSALFLVVNFFCVSVIYLMLRAQFIAIIQVLVYAGAIMVLFLFVIMLLNLQDESKLMENITYKKLSAVILALLLFSSLAITSFFTFTGKFKIMSSASESQGTVEYVGRQLYTIYSFPFELVSFILLAAIVGAIVLAQKKFE